ncbi:MAG TPA: BON domain-containing protein [Thermoanaerobaculia bacterium]|nr:BON domain-containing protein [Thermoanaerobaculia bacterium]
MNRKVILSLLALVMVFSVACKSLNQMTPSGMDDGAIELEVRAKIGEDVSNKALDVGVSSKDGVVTLSGTANSEDQKRKIGEAANDVKGVKAVINNLRVN